MNAVSRVIFRSKHRLAMPPLVLASASLARMPSSVNDATGAGQGSVHGLIRGVEAQSLLELKGLDRTGEAGNTWHFNANGKTFASFTPPHLNEHMSPGLRATVVYYREGEMLTVDDITDRRASRPGPFLPSTTDRPCRQTAPGLSMRTR